MKGQIREPGGFRYQTFRACILLDNQFTPQKQYYYSNPYLCQLNQQVYEIFDHFRAYRLHLL